MYDYCAGYEDRFGYSGYDFINETKMGTKRHQDEVKSWVLMHQDEALIETIETDIWIG